MCDIDISVDYKTTNDEFLAYPYYAMHFKKKITRIDNEIYNETIDKQFVMSQGRQKFTEQDEKNARYFLMGHEHKNTYRYGEKDGKVILLDGINGKKLQIQKPRRGSKYQDFTDDEKAKIKIWVHQLKLKVLKEGVLHFDDAYFLAQRYLTQSPQIKDILKSRFGLVIVDEMQDMDKHQYDLLESIFFRDESLCKYQRVGDKNQAIFNGTSKLEDIWFDRQKVLRISGSQRLTASTATLVKNFALFQPEGFKLDGHNSGDLKPHILSYNDSTILNVIPRFLLLLEELKTAEALSIGKKDYPVKIVAWNTEWKDGEKQPGKVRLIDYFPTFNKANHSKPIDYTCLEDYLHTCQIAGNSLEPIYNVLINATLKILRLEKSYTSSCTPFTRRSLTAFLKGLAASGSSSYGDFSQFIFDTSMQLIKGDLPAAMLAFKDYMIVFLPLFGCTLRYAASFVTDSATSAAVAAAQVPAPKNNTVSFGNEVVDVTTVHAVKGQTHSATLYLETSFNGKHESEYLAKQFAGEAFDDTRVRHKDCVKMAFVGLSRPTQLLCIAMHQNRINQFPKKFKAEVWTIIHA